MLNISGLDNGVVLDHIPAGKGMDLYKYLKLDELDCQIAIIKNADSAKMGKKDIIKISTDIELDLDVVGFISHHISINVIKDGKIVEKKTIEHPKKLVNVIKCKNPRCITSIEQELPNIFTLSEGSGKTYRCLYCEEKYEG
ncbi:MAG: aspartate carbamoyltransferase regulatory subunit [Clostridia bacterium]|nr:aspartate carbamoyltransferase regulatory subunit [Clostridia bacterium]